MANPRLSILLFILIMPSVFAIPDSIWLAMPENTTECFTIILPDDSGAILSGANLFIITTEPSDRELYWGLPGQTVSFAEVNASPENTATFPFCFSTEGKKEGQSGANFTIKISTAGTNTTRVIRGGITVSEKRDADSNPIPESPRQVINSQSDVFDIAFSKPVYFGLPNQPASLKLLIQSYSDIVLNLVAESQADVQISQESVSLSAGQPVREIGITASAGEGSWPITIRADVAGCPSCSKQVEAVLYVNQTLPEQAGWTISVFPKSLSIQGTQAVDFKLVIENNGPSSDFNISILTSLPFTLSQEAVFVGSGSSAEIPFQVTPSGPGFYSIQARVSSGTTIKTEKVSLSVNEMDSDLDRQVGDIKSQNPDLADDVEEVVGKWESSGKSLQNYQDVLNSLQQANQTQPKEEYEEETEEKQEGWPFWMWLAIIPIVVVIALVFVLRRPKETTMEIPAESNF